MTLKKTKRFSCQSSICHSMPTLESSFWIHNFRTESFYLKSVLIWSDHLFFYCSTWYYRQICPLLQTGNVVQGGTRAGILVVARPEIPHSVCCQHICFQHQEKHEGPVRLYSSILFGLCQWYCDLLLQQVFGVCLFVFTSHLLLKSFVVGWYPDNLMYFCVFRIMPLILLFSWVKIQVQVEVRQAQRHTTLFQKFPSTTHSEGIRRGSPHRRFITS